MRRLNRSKAPAVRSLSAMMMPLGGAVRLSNAGLAGHPSHCIISLSTSSSLVAFMSPEAETLVSCGFSLALSVGFPTKPQIGLLLPSSCHICSLNEICHRPRRSCAGCRAVVLIC